jgi:hypothetical protein
MVASEITEVVYRQKPEFDDDKSQPGITILLGVNRILRVLMVYRLITEVIHQINRRIYELIEYDNKGPKEILQMLVKKLPPEDGYIAVTLQRVMDLMDFYKISTRRSRVSQFIKSSSGSNIPNVNSYQKDIKLENEHDIDKDIYDVVPDDEDIEKIFTCDEVGDDVRYSKLLANIEFLDFNIFELRTISQGNELVLVINHLMEINDFYEKLNITQDKFRKYSVTIQKLYNPVSYHNKTHAADVCQTTYYFLTYCDFYNIGQISDMEAAVMVISAMVHDTDHPGVNNLYLINTRDKLALRYNDKSVLENHHIAIAFNTMLRSPDTCIYENFSNDQFRTYRDYMIDLVLATDNANHNTFIDQLRKRQGCQDFDPKNMDKKLIMSLLIHLADISNPTKPWRLCYKWIDLLFLEFFKQGDKERDKGLPITFLMDRYTTNIAKAQSGFIDHFIKPAYDLLLNIMPNIELNMKFLESNKEQWAILEESYSLMNDPKVNFKNESQIIDETEFDSSDTESSIDIIQKDLKWRKQSIMIAKKRGTIVSTNFLKKPLGMSNFEKGIVRTFTGSSSEIQSFTDNKNSSTPKDESK